MKKKYSYILLIILTGSLWGFAEVCGSRIFLSGGLPFRAAILTAAGFLIMGFFTGSKGKASHLPFTTLTAITAVQAGVFLCGHSPACRANASLALLLHSGCLMTVLLFIKNKNHSGAKAVITGSVAAAVSGIIFFHAGMKLAPCPYLLTFNTAGGFIAFMKAEIIPWSIMAGPGFAAGIYLGEIRITEKIKQPVFAALILACWTMCTLTTMKVF